MLKPEIAAKMMLAMPWASERQCLRAINEICAGISVSLSTGANVEIGGFGTFYLTFRPPHVGHDPSLQFADLGYRVNVPAKYLPAFRAHAAMAGGINGRR